jgi:hypothetical protein
MIIGITAAIAVPIAYYQIKERTEQQFHFLKVIGFNTAYGQNVTRTFMDCYNDVLKIYRMFTVLSPLNNTVDLENPDFKQYLINRCIFYHDEIRIWVALRYGS